MAWLRIDDRVRTHPKVVQAGPDAAWFWFCGICYCREHLTDGFIPKAMLASLVPGVGLSAARKHAATLMRFVLWHETEGGYRVHDFLDWNPSRADVEADREWDRRRKELYADPDLIAQIRQRDRDCCRYCGEQVNWKDRRGPHGGQFDHVIPRGDNSLENVVVACRRCNNRKGDRTPQQARMNLVPISAENQVGTSSEPHIGTSEPTRGGAIARGLGSGSTDGFGSEILEESPRETFSRRTPALIASPLEWDRKHAAVHVTEFCDWTCFPNDLADEFARKVSGVPFEEARAQVVEWARAIRRQWHGRIVPDGSPWDFWKHRWTETHGGSKPLTSGAAPDPLAGLRKAGSRG